jgi:hypothetical protein
LNRNKTKTTPLLQVAGGGNEPGSKAAPSKGAVATFDTLDMVHLRAQIHIKKNQLYKK